MSESSHVPTQEHSPQPTLASPELSGLSFSAPGFQLKASPENAIQRNVNPTPVDRKTRDEIFGSAAGPGMTLAQFESYSRRQADWFSEASLSATDQSFLWRQLNKVQSQPATLTGAGDLQISVLHGLNATDQGNLDAFCRATGTGTVRVFGTAGYPLAQRLAFGDTLTQLETIIPASVLAITVSESQVQEMVATPSLVADLRTYWSTFQPHLQGTFTPAPAGRGPEFDNVLTFLRSGQYTTLLPLRGRIRNLHRFSTTMLAQVMDNWNDTTRARPVHLVVHTPHDASAFQLSAPLFESLVLDGRNLVLFLEGQGSLASITAQIPTIAANHGQPDGSGGHHIAQAMIAGHGQATSVELAGTSAPHVTNGHVSHNSESMDIVGNQSATQDLLDALFDNMDPASARLVFAGCLVGSNRVPDGIAPADIPAHIAANPSLAQFAEQRAIAAGIPAGRIEAARASVGLSAATGLVDPATGDMGMQYGYDPNAFGPASTYVATGHEPEGVLVSAVELAATQTPQVAETQLRARLAAGVSASHNWWDECTILFVRLALDGVAPGAGIDVGRVNTLSHMTQIPFLTAWPANYNISPGSWVWAVNNHGPLATGVYNGMDAAPTFSPPSSPLTQQGRLIFEQAWIAHGGSRIPNLLTYLDGTAGLTADVIQNNLDTTLLAAHSGTFFPSGAALTSGRIRLALAWLRLDPNNTHAKAYLDTQVSNGSSGPELSPAVRSELGTISERSVLQTLGRLTNTSTVVPSGGGAAISLPDGNYDTNNDGTNDARVTPRPYLALTLNNTDISAHPSFAGRALANIPAGTPIQVVGDLDPVWAAVDHNGQIAYVLRVNISGN